MTKEEFIADFLQKSRRLKNYKLPYGMAYLSLLSKVEDDAKRKYKYKITKQTRLI
jgi:hypothetical protein